jgi:hypothetical protein
MAKLTGKERSNLPAKSFALPGGRFPINDASHGRNALARVSQHGTSEEKAKVRAAVHRKFPQIDQEEEHNGPRAHVGKSGLHYGAHDSHQAIGSCVGCSKDY